jgi:hypothetical protein
VPGSFRFTLRFSFLVAPPGVMMRVFLPLDECIEKSRECDDLPSQDWPSAMSLIGPLAWLEKG